MKALIGSELRQRVRARRWWLLLGLWTLFQFGIMIPIRAAGRRSQEFLLDPGSAIPLGPLMFGSLALLVLALSCLVIPSLTATAINGERDRGTLAVLQATLYNPIQIAMAKFLSAWIVAGAFLVATLPIFLWCYAEGGVSLLRAGAVYLVLFVMAGVLLALGLCASALFRKPALSAVIAYLAVGALTIGTLVVFGLAEATASPSFGVPERSNRWVLLAPNPFVVLADAAPRSEIDLNDPLASMQEGIRRIRDPQPIMMDVRPIPDRRPPGRGQMEPPPAPRGELPPPGLFRLEHQPAPLTWPAGLGIDLAIAALALTLVVRSLQVPVRRLAPGHRVA